MANHSATKKSIRKTVTRTAQNTQRRSRIRTFLRKVEEAITANDKKAANDALRTAESEIMSGVSKGIFKQNSASRKISRLSSRIRKLA